MQGTFGDGSGALEMTINTMEAHEATKIVTDIEDFLNRIGIAESE